MSALHNGTLNTMKVSALKLFLLATDSQGFGLSQAHYVVTQKDIRVCRPLVYVREKVLAKFAKDHHLPVITDNCPACFSQPKEVRDENKFERLELLPNAASLLLFYSSSCSETPR